MARKNAGGNKTRAVRPGIRDAGGDAAAITLSVLERWLIAPSENEHLEFKEAKRQYDWRKTLEYCVAIANEGGGHLVLGVSDKPPRCVVGSRAVENPDKAKQQIFEKLRMRVEIQELNHPAGRVVVIEIPSRPKGQPLSLDGTYLMRVGESLEPMSPDRLRRIFAEGEPPFVEQPALTASSADEVIELLDVQAYFELMKLPFPGSRRGVFTRLRSEGMVMEAKGGHAITNLGAVLLAKDLRRFETVWRRAPRVIVYQGKGKLETIRDHTVHSGYAAGFESLIGFINSQAPVREVIGAARREEVRAYPRIAIRELVANALIHQDFAETGSSVMIEIYADRIEISNPGLPLIPPERFVDEYKSRNERLADVMRRLGICEEKSSGIDKVIAAAELHQLPAPEFRVGNCHTTAVLFAHKDLSVMDTKERAWTCYLHCCLRYIGNEKMTNQSLRERFRLPDSKAETASRIIAAAVTAKLIRHDDPDGRSKRYTRYVPFWG